jgi:hypothetical protein
MRQRDEQVRQVCAIEEGVDNVHALLFYLLDVQQPSLELIHLRATQAKMREGNRAILNEMESPHLSDCEFGVCHGSLSFLSCGSEVKRKLI